MKIDTENLQGNYKKLYENEKLRPSYDRRSRFIKIRRMLKEKQKEQKKKSNSDKK